MKIGDIVQCPGGDGIGPIRFMNRIVREGFGLIEVSIRCGIFKGYTRCFYPNEAGHEQLIPLPFLSRPRLEKRSDDCMTHVACLRTKVCQETEGLKGTEHEGVDMCEDGCVWYNPGRRRRNKPTTI